MYNSGGMERILTTIANHLSQNYTVYIITAFQKDRPYFYRLDNKVHSFDLCSCEKGILDASKGVFVFGTF